MGKKILVVDDEPDITKLLKYNLEQEGFIVEVAQNGLSALEKAKSKPDLIVLDVMMPEMNGWDVLRELKRSKETEHIPVLFLTAKGLEVDEVLGLELGADDYIVKPISPRKLVARIKAIFRRTEENGKRNIQEEILTLPSIEINVANYTVTIDGKDVFFPKKEFELLAYLAQNPNRVIMREELLSSVWGKDVYVVDRTIDVHIRKIREKLGKHSSIIETVKGVGYRLAVEV